MRKRMLVYVGATLFVSAAVVAAGLTATWTAPTTNTDGSPISAPLTYNLYTGAKGAESKSQSGLTSPTATIPAIPGTQTCARVTAVANNVESAQSPEVCASVPFPTPSAPSALTLQ